MVNSQYPPGGNPFFEGPQNIISVNGSIFFTEADSSAPSQLFRYNGTPGSITQITTGSYLSSIGQAPYVEAAIGATLYFVSPDFSDTTGGAIDHTHLYSVNSDGTGLTNLTPNGVDANPDLAPVALGSEIYFVATDTAGAQIWKTDDTAGGTSRVSDINAPGSSGADGTSGLNTQNMLAVGSNLYFDGDFSSTVGVEIGVLNAANPAGALLADIFPGESAGSPNGSYPSYFTAVGNTLYFAASINATQSALWQSAGTAATTVQSALVDTSNPNSGPFDLTGLGTTLYFASTTSATGTDSNGNAVYLPFSYTSSGSLPAATVTVTSGNSVYNGSAYVPSATVSGSSGLDAGAALTYTYYVGTGTGGTDLGAAAPVNAGTYTVVAHFAGDATYTAADSTASTFDITAKSLSVTITQSAKIYDGTTAASPTYVLAGVVDSDPVTASGTASFASPDVGTGIAVNATGITLGGAAAGDYTLSNTTASTTADITAKSLSVTITQSAKIYDGTTAASPTYVLAGVVDSDPVTASGTASFASPDVGTGIAVNATGITLGGAAAGDYTLSNTTASTTADILQATPQVTVNPVTLAYGTALASSQPQRHGHVRGRRTDDQRARRLYLHQRRGQRARSRKLQRSDHLRP